MEFPKVKIKENSSTEIPKERTVIIKQKNQSIFTKEKNPDEVTRILTCGEFADRAIILAKNYDWVLGTNEHGYHILIPLKR